MVVESSKGAVDYHWRRTGITLSRHQDHAFGVFVGSGAYAAAKAGVINMTRMVALEYANKNIRVNCICPGIISTPMVQRVMGDRPDDGLVRLEPIGRLGQAEDIANAALFLASDESSFATGAPFVIDGGYIAR